MRSFRNHSGGAQSPENSSQREDWDYRILTFIGLVVMAAFAAIAAVNHNGLTPPR
jgi:hypothetical protein